MDVYYKKHRRLSGRQVCDEIIEFFKSLEEDSFIETDKYHLSEDQIRMLKYHWGDDSGYYGDLGLPFHAYEWKQQKKDGSWLRVTFPFFVVFIIIMTILVRPIKWLFTGNWWFGEKSKLEDFIGKCDTEIFGE